MSGSLRLAWPMKRAGGRISPSSFQWTAICASVGPSFLGWGFFTADFLARAFVGTAATPLRNKDCTPRTKWTTRAERHVVEERQGHVTHGTNSAREEDDATLTVPSSMFR